MPDSDRHEIVSYHTVFQEFYFLKINVQPKINVFMKKLLVAICFLCGGAIGVSAQQTDDQDQASARDQSTEQTMNQDQQEEFTDQDKIAESELPSLISQQLQSGDYSGWTVGETYKKEKDGQTFYKVELQNGEEKKWVKFDAQGNKVKEKDAKDKKHKE